MKKMLLACFMLVSLVGCSTRGEEVSDLVTVNGVVIAVYESSILISQMEDFNECDFLDSYDEYMNSETFYDLLNVSNVSADVGDMVKIKIEPEIAESYPAQAIGVEINAVSHLIKSKNCES